MTVNIGTNLKDYRQDLGPEARYASFDYCGARTVERDLTCHVRNAIRRSGPQPLAGCLKCPLRLVRSREAALSP
jgi:hypothetical protein